MDPEEVAVPLRHTFSTEQPLVLQDLEELVDNEGNIVLIARQNGVTSGRAVINGHEMDVTVGSMDLSSHEPGQTLNVNLRMTPAEAGGRFPANDSH